MLSAERASRLQALVGEAPDTTMRSGAKRKAFAKRLAGELGMEPSRVQSFVSEMTGLNFYYGEDRQTFIDFALHGL